MNPEKTYSIGDTSSLTGVSAKQLRNWEVCNYIQVPLRITCGDRAYRRYTEAHIKFIKSIKKYLDQGFTLRAATEKAKKGDSHK
jgi:DNA-binding transcriptional MerR regulator